MPNGCRTRRSINLVHEGKNRLFTLSKPFEVAQIRHFLPHLGRDPMEVEVIDQLQFL